MTPGNWRRRDHCPKPREMAAKEIDNVRLALGMQPRVVKQPPKEHGILVAFIQQRTAEMEADEARYVW